LALTAAYFAARYVGDAAAARGWLEQAPAENANPGLRAQAEAAVLLAEGRCSAARDVAEAGLMNLRDGLLGGLSSVQADALRELLDDAKAAQPAPPPAAPVHVPAFENAPAERPARAATATAAAGEIAAGPTLGLGVAVVLVLIVTLLIAVMPLPHGSSFQIGKPPIGSSLGQSGSAGDSGLIHAICPNGCPVQDPVESAGR